MYACVYACVYVCMYVCCMHVYMYVCLYACVYVRMNEWMNVWMSEWMYVCMHVCMHVCMYLCTYVHVVGPWPIRALVISFIFYLFDSVFAKFLLFGALQFSGPFQGVANFCYSAPEVLLWLFWFGGDGGVGGVGGGASNIHVVVLVLLLLLKSKFCEAACVSGRGSQHTMLHRSTTQNSGGPLEHKRISSST